MSEWWRTLIVGMRIFPYETTVFANCAPGIGHSNLRFSIRINPMRFGLVIAAGDLFEDMREGECNNDSPETIVPCSE